MALVICDISTSLDGYVTGPNDSRENPFGDGAGMLHDWMFDAATDEDRAILQEMLDGVGAIVMGRKGFDKNEGDGGWGDSGPVGDTPCFVVTHKRPTTSHPPVYTFVTDGVVSAIEQAKRAAGNKFVGLHGATVQQAHPCLTGSTRRSPSNAPKCWSPPPRRTWDFGWSGKPQPGPDQARRSKAEETLRQQTTFEAPSAPRARSLLHLRRQSGLHT
jgi:dihydrofolate reductase